MKTAKDILDKIKNPYPKDVFKSLNTKQLKELNQLMLKKFKFPLDRLSAHISRLLFDSLKLDYYNELRQDAIDDVKSCKFCNEFLLGKKPKYRITNLNNETKRCDKCEYLIEKWDIKEDEIS